LDRALESLSSEERAILADPQLYVPPSPEELEQLGPDFSERVRALMQEKLADMTTSPVVEDLLPTGLTLLGIARELHAEARETAPTDERVEAALHDRVVGLTTRLIDVFMLESARAVSELRAVPIERDESTPAAQVPHPTATHTS
jgi:hypothetical protein